MHILLVDDEALARQRLRTLLGDLAGELPPYRLSEAASGTEALQQVQAHAGPAVDLVLLDIHLPGLDGLGLAQALQALPQPPAVVFVTAHAEHAVGAFELDAADYLTKPVRRERLLQALAKARRHGRGPAWGLPATASTPPAAPAEDEHLLIQDRGRTERVPLSEVLYLRAEQKYVTVRTATRTHLLDASLSELEARYGARLLRIHRNTLVARQALRALERLPDTEDGDGWAVRLHGLAEVLPVSRRQAAAVRDALVTL